MDKTMKDLMKEFEAGIPTLTVEFKPVKKSDTVIGIETIINQNNMDRNFFDAVIMALATIVAKTEKKDIIEVFSEIIAKKKMTDMLNRRGDYDGDD